MAWYENPKVGDRRTILVDRENMYFGYKYGWPQGNGKIIFYPGSNENGGHTYPVYLLTDDEPEVIPDLLVADCVHVRNNSSVWKEVTDETVQHR